MKWFTWRWEDWETKSEGRGYSHPEITVRISLFHRRRSFIDFDTQTEKSGRQSWCVNLYFRIRHTNNGKQSRLVCNFHSGWEWRPNGS